MADQSTTISGPVQIMPDSAKRVAFELARLIDNFSNVEPDKKDRKYWLTLYRQCYKATNGNSLESILRED